MPDGSVIVTDELVGLAKNDNELHAVLLHEIVPRHHFADILRALESSMGRKPDRATQYLDSHPPTLERIRRFGG